MSNTLVTVDSSWLTANGPAPYVLSAENTTYVLSTDVSITSTSFTGPIFKITGRNTYLEMGTHRCYMNGLDYPQAHDGHVTRKVDYTVRAVDTKDVVVYGGKYFDVDHINPVIDPTSPEYPPLNSWADTK